MYLPLLAEGFGRYISEVFDSIFRKSGFGGLDSDEIAVVDSVAIDSKFPLFVAGKKFWAGGGIKTGNGGLENSGDNRMLFGEGSRKAKECCP